jgi:DNA-binding MurR/RpiR family transcriptional regulator
MTSGLRALAIPYAPVMPEHILEERIAAATDLAPAERRVAQFFAESADQATFLPVAKIAAKLGVSTATVVRTAQRLGYTGLPELKDELRAAMLRRLPTPAERFAHSLDELTGGLGALPATLFTRQARMLTEAAQTVSPKDFARAVELLAAAERIIVFGQPPYGPLAEHFATEVRRYGRHVQLIGLRHEQIVEELLDIGPDDALVVVAYHQSYPTRPALDLVLDRAREQHTPAVLVTDTLALALKRRYTVALSAPRDEIEKQPTPIVPVAILEALQLGISAYDRPRSLAAMAMRDELRKRLS